MTSRTRALALSAALAWPTLPALVSGCGGGGSPAMQTAADTCMTGSEKDFVLVAMKFARQDKPGVSEGFDLDHYTATQGDPKTCGHASLKSPEGQTGIDNQFSAVLPAIDAQTNGAVDGEIQGAINDGMLLIGFDVEHVDDAMNDDCVDLTVRQLSGTPTLGTDQILTANETFDVAANSPTSHVQGKIANGVLEAGPFELALPVKVLDASFTLQVHGAYVTLDLAGGAATGTSTGLVGGGLNVMEVVNTLEQYAIGAQLKQMLPGLLMSIADLDQDPTTMVCQEFSVAMTYDAKPAFINH